MQYTEHLHLPVLENSDGIKNLFTQANTISETLEDEMGGYVDDLETLPTIVTDITNLQNTVATIESEVEQNANNITQLNNKIVAIENGKMTLKNENNEDVVGTVTRYYFTATSIGGITEYDVPLANSHTGVILRIADVTANITLNATALFNISSPAQCKIINAIAYNINTSTTSPDALRTSTPTFICTGFKKIPNDYNLYLNFHMQEIMMSISEQASFPDYSNINYQVVIELWKPDNE